MYLVKSLNAPTHQQKLDIDSLILGIYDEFGTENDNTNDRKTYTKTIITDNVDKDLPMMAHVLNRLKEFNTRTEELRNEDRSTHYRTFRIPKRSGGMRQIDDPDDEIRNAMNNLMEIFNACSPKYHCSAYAYIEGRSTIDAVRKLMSIKPNNFLHLDFHSFFNNTTSEFAMRQIEQVYPFAVWCEHEDFKREFETALSLCFYRNGLVQGNAISCMITNIMMIPFDHMMNKMAREANMVYVRYADDIYVSSYGAINKNIWEATVQTFLRDNNAAFTLNTEKTHTMRVGGPVWILGVKIDADKRMTVGTENKRLARAYINNFFAAINNGSVFSIEETQEMMGTISYFAQIEKEFFSNLINKYERKYNMNYRDVCARILRGEM